MKAWIRSNVELHRAHGADMRRQILEYISAKGPATPMLLALELDLTEDAVRQQLTKLVHKGYLRITELKPIKRYGLT